MVCLRDLDRHSIVISPSSLNRPDLQLYHQFRAECFYDLCCTQSVPEKGHIKQGLKVLTCYASLCTECLDRMSHRKWRATKQHPHRAIPGHQISCCLVYLHFQCNILSSHSVHTVEWCECSLRPKWIFYQASKSEHSPFCWITLAMCVIDARDISFGVSLHILCFT